MPAVNRRPQRAGQFRGCGAVVPVVRRTGFSLVEVVIAMAIFATVLLGMLALLANGVNTRAEVRRDTIAVQICQQIHQSLRGFRVGIDDTQPAPASPMPGLLDEFFPFSFDEFPAAGKPAMVLGFDSEGNKRGKADAADYSDGTTRDGVTYLATMQGLPVAGKPGLTNIIIGIEFPAGEKQAARKRREFRVLMTPTAKDTADTEATP